MNHIHPCRSTDFPQPGVGPERDCYLKVSREDFSRGGMDHIRTLLSDASVTGIDLSGKHLSSISRAFLSASASAFASFRISSPFAAGLSGNASTLLYLLNCLRSLSCCLLSCIDHSHHLLLGHLVQLICPICLHT